MLKAKKVRRDTLHMIYIIGRTIIVAIMIEND